MLVARGEIREAPRNHADIEVLGGAAGLLAGLTGDIARATGRRHAYACRDLTERTHHIGGAIGAALCTYALSEGWVERIAGTRALAITAQGREAFASLGISLDG